MEIKVGDWVKVRFPDTSIHLMEVTALPDDAKGRFISHDHYLIALKNILEVRPPTKEEPFEGPTMSEGLKKYWVRNTYWTDTDRLEEGNPYNRVPMFKAADVEGVLSDAKIVAEWVANIPDGNALPLKEATRLLAGLEGKG